MKTSAYCFIMTTIVILISGFAATTQPNFEASYRLLLDGTGYYSGSDMSIGSAAMSDDGSTIIAYTYYYYGSERDLFIIDTSSGARTSIALDPTGSWGVIGASMAISQDGSVAFVADTASNKLFRVAGGVMTKILGKDDWADVNRVNTVRTTSAGDWVFFEEDNDDIWKLPGVGGTPIRAVNDSEVQTNGGGGRRISGFDISDDGATIVFCLLGYENGARTLIINPEIFVHDSGGYRQLTDDGATSYKTDLNISGDGSTAISYDQVSDYWTTLDVTTGAATLIYPTDYNVAGAVLTTDGSRIFFNQNDLEGGQLIRKDGTDGIGIFPDAPIYIGASYWPQISGDGTRVSFISSTRLLYTGELWPTTVLSPVPTVGMIGSIARRDWEHELSSAPAGISQRLQFMSHDHHLVRNFVVREIPRLGRSISMTDISHALHLSQKRTLSIVEDLKKNLFFLVRGNGAEVSWAFPVTAEETGHHLVFSTGERLDAA